MTRRRSWAFGLLVLGLSGALWFASRVAPRDVPVTLRFEGDRESTAQVSVSFERDGESFGGASWTFTGKAPPTVRTTQKLPRDRVTARVEMRSRDTDVRLNVFDLDAAKDELSLRISLDFSHPQEKPQAH